VNVFFDLDGTLTDSSPGIVNCFGHALRSVGVAPPADERLRQQVGPPLAAALEALLGPGRTDLIDAAIAAYRERFELTGILENSLYPGTARMLDTLRDRGHRLRLVTAKPEPYALRVLQQFQIDAQFDGVHAPTLADRGRTKATLVAAALAAVGGHRGNTVMVGDRADDIIAAHANGIPCIAVGWGYGSDAERIAAGADTHVADVSALLAHVEHLAVQLPG
jgi:phosphoglycolate phosphatase